jgi:hypothetical protein
LPPTAQALRSRHRGHKVGHKTSGRRETHFKAREANKCVPLRSPPARSVVIVAEKGGWFMLAGKLAVQRTERSMGAFDTLPTRISMRGRLGTWRSRLVSNHATVLNGRYDLFRLSHPRVCGLVSEIRSFCHRILRLGSKDYNPGCGMGPYLETTAAGFRRLNRKTLARIDCIQRLHASRPWLSPADWDLILLGWDEGYRFCDSSRRGME